MALRKELSLFSATLYGVGIILGAGIYVLIGHAADIAGNAFWMSFAAAAIIAAFTGLSYAELAGMFPKTAAEYVYTRQAFNRPWLSFAVQWLMIITLIISASTVALGFGGYLSRMTGFGIEAAAALLIVALSALSYLGIKESARYNIIATLVEASGLALVIAIGAFFIFRPGIDYFSSPAGLGGILSATSLIFFAYIGFEELVNLSEETKNAKRIIPKAWSCRWPSPPSCTCWSRFPPSASWARKAWPPPRRRWPTSLPSPCRTPLASCRSSRCSQLPTPCWSY